MKLANLKEKMYPLNLDLLIDTYEDKGAFYNPVFSPIFGEDLPYGNLFAYLFRRFGYPNTGWDGYKEFAAYLLTTSRKDTVIKIRPYTGSRSSVELQFSIFVSAEMYESACLLYRRRERPKTWQGLEEPLRSIFAAADKAGRELLRPVWVRDTAINVLGPVEDGYIRKSADYASAAGYASGMLGNVDPELMGDICHVVYELGKGNVKLGMRRLIEKSGVKLKD